MSAFPVSTCKRQLMRFVGTAGNYRKVYNNFSAIAEPQINLLSRRMKLKWTSACKNAFGKLRATQRNEPVKGLS